MTVQLTQAEKARYFDALLANGTINLAELVDFSRALETELLKMVELTDPVWSNPTTGKVSSSVHAAFNALDFFTSKHWSQVVKEAKRYRSFHYRNDLPNRSGWPTICLALADVEDLVIRIAPRKGRKVIDEFKAAKGLS